MVRKLKYDGTVRSEWEGEVVAVEQSEWLVVLHHPAEHRKWQDGERVQVDRVMVHCLSQVRPISILLTFDEFGRFSDAKCDAALPAVAIDSHIDFVDLDLDIIVNTDLSYYVQDYVELALNRQTMRIPDTVIQQAQDAIDLAKTMVEERAFPFNHQFIPQLTI